MPNPTLRRLLVERPVELRAAPEGSTSPGVLFGYALTYNEQSRDLGGWSEIIDPACFVESLARHDRVMCRAEHKSSMLLGTTDAELLRMIKSYDMKAAKLSQLKEFDALEIKSVLHGQWLSREPKNAGTAAPVKEKTGEALPIETPSSPQASLNTTPNSATPAQKQRLLDLRMKLQGPAWPLEEQKAFLAKHNAAGFVTLSEAVAAELLADLEARAAKLSAA